MQRHLNLTAEGNIKGKEGIKGETNSDMFPPKLSWSTVFHMNFMERKKGAQKTR